MGEGFFFGGALNLGPSGGPDDWARVEQAWTRAAYKYPIRLLPGAWTIAAGSFQRMWSGTTTILSPGCVITSQMTDTTDPDGNTGHWGPFFAATPSTSFTHSTTLAAQANPGDSSLSLTDATGYTVGATIYLDFVVNAAIYTVTAVTPGVAPAATVTLDRRVLRTWVAGTTVRVSPPSTWYPSGRPQDIAVIAEPGAILQGTWARAIEIIGGKNCTVQGLRIVDQGNGLGGSVTILCSFDWGGQNNKWARMAPESTGANPAGNLLALEDNECSGYDGCYTLGGANGFNIVGSNGVWMRNCTAEVPTASGIKIENDSGDSSIGNDDVTIVNLRVVGAGVSPNTAAAINVLGNASNIRLHACEVSDSYSGVSFSSGTFDTEIVGGTIARCSHEAILYTGTTGHRVVGLKTKGNYTSAPTGHGVLSFAANSQVTFADIDTDETGYPFSPAFSGYDITVNGWRHKSSVSGTAIGVNASAAGIIRITDATLNFTGTGTKVGFATGSGSVMHLTRCKLIAGTYGFDCEVGTGYVRDCDFSAAATSAYITGGALSFGTVTLNGATGVDIPFPDARTNSQIILTRKTAGGTPGNAPTWTVSVGSKFTVTGTAGDTSVYSYQIVGS